MDEDFGDHQSNLFDDVWLVASPEPASHPKAQVDFIPTMSLGIAGGD